MGLGYKKVHSFIEKLEDGILPVQKDNIYGGVKIKEGSQIIIDSESLTKHGKKCVITILGRDGKHIECKRKKDKVYKECQVNVRILLDTFAPEILKKLEEKKS